MLALPPGHAARRPREGDYAAILEAIGIWWDTPNRAALGSLLPRLFLQHFTDTSFLVESGDGGIAAFLIGFRSQDHPAIAYIHFVGVDPALRKAGLARGLYEAFFEEMTARGCTEVHAITGPANRRSQAFHAAMGFAVHGDVEIDGVLAYADYDGPDQARVTFTRPL